MILARRLANSLSMRDSWVAWLVSRPSVRAELDAGFMEGYISGFEAGVRVGEAGMTWPDPVAPLPPSGTHLRVVT